MAAGKTERPETAVTWETYEEIGKPAGVVVVPGSRLGPDDVVICSPYRFGDALSVPGNLVSTCRGCRGAVHHRPHVPAVARRMCIACAMAEGFEIPDARPTAGATVGPARNPPHALGQSRRTPVHGDLGPKASGRPQSDGR